MGPLVGRKKLRSKVKTKVEKELAKAQAELVQVRKDLEEAVACSIDLSDHLLAASRERDGLVRNISALQDAVQAQEREINQLRSNLGAFRDRCKARVSELNMEARFWGIDIDALLKA